MSNITIVHPPKALDLYQVVCLGAVVILTMVMLEKNMGLWCLFPAILGIVGVLGPWRGGAIFLVGALTLAVVAHSRGIDPAGVLYVVLYRVGPFRGNFAPSRAIEPFPDLIACGAVLAYVVAHGRLISIHQGIFPPDSRKPAGVTTWRHKEPAQRRSADAVRPLEVGVLLASVPLFAGLAALALFWLLRVASALVLFPEALRAPLAFLWLGGLCLAIFAAALGYKKVTDADGEESSQYLQDQLWRETRREQGRISRWLTWARLKKQRRKETT